MWNLDSFCKSITTDGFITELSCVVAKVLYFEYLTWSLCYTNQKLWQLLAWEQFIGSMLTTHYLELKTEYVEYWHLEAQSVVATWKYFQRLGCRSIAKWSNCNTVADCISLTVLKDLGRSKLHAVGHGYVSGDSLGSGGATATSGCLRQRKEVTDTNSPKRSKDVNKRHKRQTVLSLVKNLDGKKEFTRD